MEFSSTLSKQCSKDYLKKNKSSIKEWAQITRFFLWGQECYVMGRLCFLQFLYRGKQCIYLQTNMSGILPSLSIWPRLTPYLLLCLVFLKCDAGVLLKLQALQCYLVWEPNPLIINHKWPPSPLPARLPAHNVIPCSDVSHQRCTVYSVKDDSR